MLFQSRFPDLTGKLGDILFAEERGGIFVRQTQPQGYALGTGKCRIYVSDLTIALIHVVFALVDADEIIPEILPRFVLVHMVETIE